MDSPQSFQGVSISEARRCLFRVRRPGKIEAGLGFRPDRFLRFPHVFRRIHLGHRPDLGQGGRELVRLERLAVPAVFPFYEGYALPLDRLGQQDRGLSRLPDLGQAGKQGIDVVPVDDEGVPTERLELSGENARVAPVHGFLGLAETIDVDDGAEVLETEMGAGVGRFPDRSLRALAVPHDDENPPGRFSELHGRGHPHPDRKALSERAGGRLDPFHSGRRMPLENGIDLAQVHELGGSDDPGLGVSRPEDGRGMSLGQDELVVPPVLGIGRIVAHLAEEETGGDLGHGQAGRRMAGPGLGGHLERMDAEPGGDGGEGVATVHGFLFSFDGSPRGGIIIFRFGTPDNKPRAPRGFPAGAGRIKKRNREA